VDTARKLLVNTNPDRSSGFLIRCDRLDHLNGHHRSPNPRAQSDASHLSSQPIEMAATDSSMPVNGSYVPQSFEANNFSASSANSATGYSGSQQQEGGQAGNATTSEIPKDEVGWYFVEQYYTTLSKSPDKLYVSTADGAKQLHVRLT
jgi:hypothetical protein